MKRIFLLSCIDDYAHGRAIDWSNRFPESFSRHQSIFRVLIQFRKNISPFFLVGIQFSWNIWIYWKQKSPWTFWIDNLIQEFSEHFPYLEWWLVRRESNQNGAFRFHGVRYTEIKIPKHYEMNNEFASLIKLFSITWHTLSPCCEFSETSDPIPNINNDKRKYFLKRIFCFIQ